MLQFMSLVLTDVSNYWEGVWQCAGYPASSVYYSFPAPGLVLDDPCQQSRQTNDETAEYCAGTDTIIVSQALAVALWNGREHANSTTFGFTTRDFAVASPRSRVGSKESHE